MNQYVIITLSVFLSGVHQRELYGGTLVGKKQRGNFCNDLHTYGVTNRAHLRRTLVLLKLVF